MLKNNRRFLTVNFNLRNVLLYHDFEKIHVKEGLYFNVIFIIL